MLSSYSPRSYIPRAEQNIDEGERFKPEVDEHCLEDLKDIKCLEDAEAFEKHWEAHINDSMQLRKYLKALKKGYTHELINEGILSKPDKSKLQYGSQKGF